MTSAARQPTEYRWRLVPRSRPVLDEKERLSSPGLSVGGLAGVGV
jgi:hypothetical protein